MKLKRTVGGKISGEMELGSIHDWQNCGLKGAKQVTAALSQLIF
jgi:hypothetical protein